MTRCWHGTWPRLSGPYWVNSCVSCITLSLWPSRPGTRGQSAGDGPPTTGVTSQCRVQGTSSERLSVTGLDGVNVLTGQRSGHHQGGRHDWETLPRWLLRLPSESPHQNLQENNESHVLVCVEVSGKKSRKANQKVESSLYSVLRPNLIIIWGSQISINSITFTWYLFFLHGAKRSRLWCLERKP